MPVDFPGKPKIYKQSQQVQVQARAVTYLVNPTLNIRFHNLPKGAHGVVWN